MLPQLETLNIEALDPRDTSMVGSGNDISQSFSLDKIILEIKEEIGSLKSQKAT
jgi:hypothetical protein